MAELRGVFAVVFPAVYVIGAAVLVAVNAAVLRLYLLRRDPGWLEDGEFERIRWPLAPGGRLRAVRGRGGPAPAAAGRLQRAAGRGVLLRPPGAGGGRRSTPAAWPGRRSLRVAVLILVLANPWAPQILALLGLFDNWFDFRRWAEPPPGEGEGTRPGRQA